MQSPDVSSSDQGNGGPVTPSQEPAPSRSPRAALGKPPLPDGLRHKSAEEGSTLLPRLRAALEKSFSYKQQREEQLYLQDQAAQAVQLLYTQDEPCDDMYVDESHFSRATATAAVLTTHLQPRTAAAAGGRTLMRRCSLIRVPPSSAVLPSMMSAGLPSGAGAGAGTGVGAGSGGRPSSEHEDGPFRAAVPWGRARSAAWMAPPNFSLEKLSAGEGGAWAAPRSPLANLSTAFTGQRPDSAGDSSSLPLHRPQGLRPRSSGQEGGPDSRPSSAPPAAEGSPGHSSSSPGSAPGEATERPWGQAPPVSSSALLARGVWGEGLMGAASGTSALSSILEGGSGSLEMAPDVQAEIRRILTTARGAAAVAAAAAAVASIDAALRSDAPQPPNSSSGPAEDADSAHTPGGSGPEGWDGMASGGDMQFATGLVEELSMCQLQPGRLSAESAGSLDQVVVAAALTAVARGSFRLQPGPAPAAARRTGEAAQGGWEREGPRQGTPAGVAVTRLEVREQSDAASSTQPYMLSPFMPLALAGSLHSSSMGSPASVGSISPLGVRIAQLMEEQLQLGSPEGGARSRHHPLGTSRLQHRGSSSPRNSSAGGPHPGHSHLQGQVHTQGRSHSPGSSRLQRGTSASRSGSQSLGSSPSKGGRREGPGAGPGSGAASGGSGSKLKVGLIGMAVKRARGWAAGLRGHRHSNSAGGSPLGNQVQRPRQHHSFATQHLQHLKQPAAGMHHALSVQIPAQYSASPRASPRGAAWEQQLPSRNASQLHVVQGAGSAVFAAPSGAVRRVSNAGEAGGAGGGARRIRQLMIKADSVMPQGEWSSTGAWVQSEDRGGRSILVVPPELQQIPSEDLVKEKQLGRGSAGSVWLARWRGVEVALKESLDGGVPACGPWGGGGADYWLPPTDSRPGGGMPFDEAQRLAALRHPCVISLFGVVAEPGCCALAVEYMCDGSLKSALRVLAGLSNSRGTSAPGTRGPGTNGTRPSGSALSTPQGGTSASAPGGGGDGDASPASSAAGAGSSVDGQCPVPRHACAAIALQAARGMEYLHSQQVVHFDLKCENLLCDLRDLERPVVKIGDLGLSKQKKERYITGNMRGTIPFMAPELWSDDQVTEKVDVYSFGICLWEIWGLCKESPFQGMGTSDIFAGVLTGTLRPDIPADMHPDWAALMKACWHGDASQRPTFTEVAETLEELVRTWKAETEATNMAEGS